MTAINRITLGDIEQFAQDGTLSLYQAIATKSAIYPGQGTPLGLAYVALKLNGEAGELAEHVGKAMRDDSLIEFHLLFPNTLEFNSLTPEREALLIKEIGDVLWYLSAACNELGIDLEDAALINLEKLRDRTERDALRGSGDVR